MFHHPNKTSTENFRHIQQRVEDELAYMGHEYEQIPINFQLTLIFDHSLHDAFSRVLHKLIDCLPFLEDLLNVFVGVRRPHCMALPMEGRACANIVSIELRVHESIPLRHRFAAVRRDRRITCQPWDS